MATGNPKGVSPKVVEAVIAVVLGAVERTEAEWAELEVEVAKAWAKRKSEFSNQS